MTSPSVCTFSGNSFNYKNCNFYYLTDKKKLEGKSNNLNGTLVSDYLSAQERFDNISNWTLSTILHLDPIHVYIEDYSYGSTGRVFNIAENLGLLKYKLWTLKINFSTIPPTVIKKFATTKGNADKAKMEEAFISETGVDIKKILGLTPSQWNPSSDIIDSYFICKYGYDQTIHSKQ